jgi:hypothetical protein
MKPDLEKHMFLCRPHNDRRIPGLASLNHVMMPRTELRPRVLPCEIDNLFVLERWNRVMIAYGEVTPQE